MPMHGAYKAKLLEFGLRRCMINEVKTSFSQELYVGPDGENVPPLWFAPTCHGWYWTPTKPSDCNDVNWMPVSLICAIGGQTQGENTAEKHGAIIQWLYQYNIERGQYPTV